MSKYSEALERYHNAKPFEIHHGFLGLSIVSNDEQEYKTLKKAVEKAEKYDEVEPYIPTIKEHDIRDYVLYLQSENSALYKENQELIDENKILKDGIKTILDFYKISIKELDDDQYELSDQDATYWIIKPVYNKIKAMLEVLENENQSK